MMPIFNKLFFLSLLCLLFINLMSCSDGSNKYVDSGFIKDNKYTNNEINWSIEIPNGFKSQKKFKLKKRFNEIQLVSLKTLINFEKTRFDKFSSTLIPLDDYSVSVLTQPKKFLESIDNNRKADLKLYKRHFHNVSSTQVETFNINGHDFLSYSLMFSLRGEITVITETYFNKIINNQQLLVLISSQTPEYKQEIYQAWENSNFDVIQD